ncbi:hypothetical protein Nepgr_032885 [Nepenthes gracilis]|uniref:Toprim domain-containing protein n=1 Tax=Nepenthes gracilis TaxID=150966 RepID=A0AAD3TKA7_NEPGR|nr:hypothetical protein Nepgr_032885 [Nepenthes gracilis]
MILSHGHSRSLNSLLPSNLLKISLHSVFLCKGQNCSISCPTKRTMTTAKLPLSSSRSSKRLEYPNFSHLWVSAPKLRCGSRFSSYAPVRVNMDQPVEDETIDLNKLKVLKQKIEAYGINCESSSPGFYTHLICPKCKGGRLMERSLSFHMNQTPNFAMWRCFRAECGWTGQASVDGRLKSQGVDHVSEHQSLRGVKDGSLGLEALGDQLLAYFAERMISRECLQRNFVMQLSGDKNVIAFTYRQNGVLVGCKYRCINKKFWQEKGTEKTLYGLDDIKGASEIIIVEGEIDKLSMEEAGFCNCVSVPGGAPRKVSAKELPPWEKDIAYQYIWNCKEYLDKASRIILATDGDAPGQALAEELARRLGKERCWRVCWPHGEYSSCFKDANEVLMNLGADALRKTVQQAQLIAAILRDCRTNRKYTT